MPLVTAPTTVDEYLAALPPPARTALEQLRETIRAAAPDATELISYQMPALKVGGRLLVSYAAFKRHYSLFPASGMVRDALGAEVDPYFVGQGTFRFPADRPLPFELIARIVKIRLEELATQSRS
jgi:uncharacterized protein YdhG (YjbR/CyaY superfamily)